MESHKRSWRALILGAVAFVIITAALIIGIQAIGLENIRRTIEQAGPFAPLIYILVKILTYVFAPLSSGPIQLSAGILFGLWPGTFYTLIGEVIGGSISFWIARKFGRPIVRRLVGEDGLRRVDSFYEMVGEWRSLLYARLFLFSIYDFISYAAGFTSLKFRTYVIISLTAGFIPTFIAVALGTTLTEERSGLILVYALVGIACAVPLLMYKRIRRWLKMDSPQQVNDG
jgi:uncharacterized membrane protein YdjX (TVP38/TMEM64 family)